MHKVQSVFEMVKNFVLKRYDASPILRVSAKAFGKGRIMPLVAKYP